MLWANDDLVLPAAQMMVGSEVNVLLSSLCRLKILALSCTSLYKGKNILSVPILNTYFQMQQNVENHRQRAFFLLLCWLLNTHVHTHICFIHTKNIFIATFNVFYFHFNCVHIQLFLLIHTYYCRFIVLRYVF